MSRFQSPRTNGPLILPFNGKAPRIHSSAYVAPNAVIVGDVEIAEDASVFYGVVIRADVGSIRIGARSNIQDNSVIHTEEDSPTVIGEDVTVGHQALVHACTVGDGTLVGMQSSLLSRSVIGAGCIIGG
ncbi:MAG: gamma carbonic anhydrase family protein, partial [Corynebacterium variabile]